MGLFNIFRNDKSNDILPLTQGEKIIFVKEFLQTHQLLPDDYGDVAGDDLASLVGTPQYTLVMYLDFLYTFTMSESVRKKYTKLAVKLGLDLHDFNLAPDSLVKLAICYTSLRKLPEFGWEGIQKSWNASLNNSNESSFDDLRSAYYWWENNVVIPIQLFDLLEKKVQENIADVTYMDKVSHQLSLNTSLTDAYLNTRNIE